MDKLEALKQLADLVGQDLRILAEQYGVTVVSAASNKFNKGWAGHTVERFLGLAQNSSSSPDFGDWELKLIPLKLSKTRQLTVKETMAITMINPTKVIAEDFEESHLYKKMRDLVIVGRIFESKQELASKVYLVNTFNLDDEEIYAQVKADYDLVRQVIKERGFNELSGKMGVYIQPRTKGAGHGSKSRAFYARASFLKKILIMPELQSDYKEELEELTDGPTEVR